MALDDGSVGISVAILVVDDHAESRAALGALLSSPDYRLVEASSGAEGLRRLLEEEFALLMVDVSMPNMNGFEFVDAVKGRTRTASIPILFLTAHQGESELLRKGYRAGAVDYLVKPLVPEMVTAKVAVFAELYRQRKRIERQSALLVEAERNESELRVLELRLAGERRYRALAEAIPHIVWTARADGAIDYFNLRWFEYTGLSREDAAGSWERAIHPDDLPRCRQEWAEALCSGAMMQIECRLCSLDGGCRWHLCRAVPERGPTGQVLSWLGTFTDIEDQRRAHTVLTEFKGTLDAVLDAVFIFEAAHWLLALRLDGAPGRSIAPTA